MLPLPYCRIITLASWTDVLQALGYSKCWHEGTFLPNHNSAITCLSTARKAWADYLSLLGRLMGLEKCLPLPYIRAHIRRIGTPISPSPGKVAQAWGWQPKCPVLAFTATPPTAKSLIYSCNPCTRESQTSRMGWHIPAEIKQARTLSWSKDLAWSPLFTAGTVSGFKGMTTLRLQLTIIPTPPGWTCNFMPAGKSCQNQDRISICENPSSPTSQWDNFTKPSLM